MRARYHHLIWLLIIRQAAGCSFADPSRDAVFESLGPEPPGVPPGPLHRPGQPCLVCHGEAPGISVFSVAGTVYKDRASLAPLGEVEIALVDVKGRTFKAKSNCAGNFFIRPAQFEPAYPLWVTLRLGQVTTEMESPIFRAGACATCHSGTPASDSAGAVVLLEDPAVAPELPPDACVPGAAND